MEKLKQVQLSDFKNIPSDTQQYSLDFIENRGALILSETETGTIVGITEKAEENIFSLLSAFHHGQVDFVSIQQVELSSFLGKRFGKTSEQTQQKRITASAQQLDKLANDAPVINFVNSLCIDAIRANASDIHLEAGVTSVRLRYRIDGVLKTVQTIEKSQFPAISSRIKLMADMNILEKRLPQDGRITVSVGQENVDLRVSIIPIAGGESIVMRILGRSAAPFSLEKLGFAKKQLLDIRRMITVPHGLILVTGPTGSGKTTTLNAIMKELVSEEINIISIEDPVEFVVDGVNQIQINEEIGLGFNTILRRVLRQDPDIIMVGEIRDASTAETALRAALTGHLVLSTLHTNDSISVIPRLINMGIEPYLIAAVLRGCIAQRLVRKVETFKNNVPVYKGRTVISEEFVTDTGLEELIQKRTPIRQLQKYLKNRGMAFMEDDAKEKVQAGIATYKEIEREILFKEENNASL